jgi:hypothetical protein
MKQETITEKKVELYSQNAISIATFFGGPLAAGILARKNFINLGNEESAKNAIILGVISTVVLFAGIILLPESIMDKIPNSVIPFIYTGIIYLLIEKYQGVALKNHKENNLPFYSAWKATGIGTSCMLIIFGGIFSYVALSPEDFDTQKYDSGIAVFNKNEAQALELFELIENSIPSKVINHIDMVGIPAWRQNIEILEALDKIEGLHDQFKQQNATLKEYSLLRIDSYELIRKAIAEDSDKYNDQINEINERIDDVLKQL